MNDEQRDFIAKNGRNYRTRRELQAALEASFPNVPCKYSTLTRECRKSLWPPKDDDDENPIGRPPDKAFHADIKRLLEEDPQISARQIAWRLGRDHSSVLYVLKNVFGLEFKKTRWVPHQLSEDDRKRRVSLSKALLETLQEAESKSFRFLVTGDESWFFYSSPRRGLWIPPESEEPRAPRPSAYAPKTMITVFWGVDGPSVVLALPCDEKWNGEYFRDTVVSEILKSELYKKAQRQKQKYILHMDNAPAHRARIVREELAKFRISLAPHPPYSPDLAPSDFFLFGCLKERARGIEFRDSEEICEWIRDQFTMFGKATVLSVFRNWQERLNECIRKGGDYI